LNQALQWIRYPIPNKKDLLNRLNSAKIFSKFDMKSGFLQIQIQESDRYKLLLQYLLGNMSGMLCHSVWRTPLQLFRKSWMIFSILIIICHCLHVEAMPSKIILMMPKNQKSNKFQESRSRFKIQDSRIIKIKIQDSNKESKLKIQESREDLIKISIKRIFQNIE